MKILYSIVHICHVNLFFFFRSHIVTCSSLLSGMNQRNGTDVDAGNVLNVFQKLGYTVKVYNDQTVAQIMQVLTAGMVHSNKFLYSFSSYCPLQIRFRDEIVQ